MIEVALRLGLDKPAESRRVVLRQGEFGNMRLKFAICEGGAAKDVSLYNASLCVAGLGVEVPCEVDDGALSLTVPRELAAKAGKGRAYVSLSQISDGTADDADTVQTDAITTQAFELEVLEGVEP